MKVIYSESETGFKTAIIYASKEEAISSPEIIRHICDSGPSKRRKALELGILSQELYDKASNLRVFGEVSIGCGYKDFSFISKTSLHEIHNVGLLDLKIVENNKVIL